VLERVKAQLDCFMKAPGSVAGLKSGCLDDRFDEKVDHDEFSHRIRRIDTRIDEVHRTV
jgi:hypothetical protein